MGKLPKLVRDNIPGILASSGLRHDIEVLSDEDYIKALEDKLTEELGEYYESRKSEYADSIEELVDLYEVILALAFMFGYPSSNFSRLVNEKRKNKGSFKNRILLKKIYEEDQNNDS